MVAVFGGATAQNLRSSRNQGNCNTNFNATLTKYYANDAECSNLIYKAFDTVVKAQCPPTAVGSPVHLCMNKNGTAVSKASISAMCIYLMTPDFDMGCG